MYDPHPLHFIVLEIVTFFIKSICIHIAFLLIQLLIFVHFPIESPCDNQMTESEYQTVLIFKNVPSNQYIYNLSNPAAFFIHAMLNWQHQSWVKKYF